jgi:trehalose 6-phosphate phosphatase
MMWPKLPPAQPNWAFFLDVDGTLLDLAETPDAVHVDADLLTLLTRLHAACGGALALVSGRAIVDLDTRLGQLQIPRAGQHGLERRAADGRLSRVAPAAESMRRLDAVLTELTLRYPTLLLERKGLTLALHYRRMPALASFLHRTVKGELAALADATLELQRGKFVLEVKPAGIDKGSAIEAYLDEAPFAGRKPVFIGDDLNDEHGFAAVNRYDGLSIRVGHGHSCALYRLSNINAVRAWLAGALEKKET